MTGRGGEPWPDLPLEEWKDTYATLHMYSQIVGKVRLALAPAVNHWWHTTLSVDASGLTTFPIPYGKGVFEIRFDFIDHRLVIQTSPGAVRMLTLEPRSVADFYRDVMAALRSLGIEVSIWPMPVEIENPIRFDQDRQHVSYDARQAHRFWRVLVIVDKIFNEFRGRFLGKASPVQFFWGSFDHSLTRFSGRRAPQRPELNAVDREAYSHEVWTAGFWPGSDGVHEAAFFASASPEPEGFSKAAIGPENAFYYPEMKLFLLRYDDARRAPSPKDAVMEFLQTTYEAEANLAKWDRENLERR